MLSSCEIHIGVRSEIKKRFCISEIAVFTLPSQFLLHLKVIVLIFLNYMVNIRLYKCGMPKIFTEYTYENYTELRYYTCTNYNKSDSK